MESIKERRFRGRLAAQELKREVIASYSHGRLKCSSCEEDNLICLTIDHINGGGEAHKRSIGIRSGSMYLWLKKQGFPSGYKVLCANCQRIKVREEGEFSVPFIGNASSRYGRNLRLRVKSEVLSHYSEVDEVQCSHCGQDDLVCLSIDHSNGRGRAHRHDLGLHRGGYRFYLWLRDQKYPLGYQVLCANCQSIKRVESGECLKAEVI